MLKQEALTKKIIGVFFNVYNELGAGFLESIYQTAMKLALEAEGLKVLPQAPIKVWFRGQVIGEFYADLLVEDAVIVELKAVKALDPAHEAQLLHYLRATEIEVGLLMNFGAEPVFKRHIYENTRKKGRRLDG